MATTWLPSSWRQRPALQQPEWPDVSELEASLEELRKLPPLVFAGEARTLQSQLAQVARGEAFLLQAGDCAEGFGDFSADAIRDKLKLILQMSVVLSYGAGMPVVKVGRIAGQFAKPRSSPIEFFEGRKLPAFRGHAVNDSLFDADARRADPKRLITAYHQSAATLNLLRAFTKGGFADISRLHHWNLEFVAASRQGQRYEALARQIDRALRFMAACGVDLEADRALHQVDFFTSHEALLLGYEEALTRQDSLTGHWYDCSAHLLWIGDRTRQLDGAHVEFLSGIKNPVACKLGPVATPADAVALCETLDPEQEPGRLSFIIRMGAARVEELLPPLIRGVTGAGWQPVWVCDPMHANTFVSSSGFKTRRLEDILAEINGFFAVHKREGSAPGGVHLELTHHDVTECLGGSEEILDHNLEQGYQALCDPRLNPRQSLDLAFQLAEMLQAI